MAGFELNFSPLAQKIPQYWLKNARVPISLLSDCALKPQTREGLCCVDIEINQGEISQILPPSDIALEGLSFNLKKGIVLPCFIDSHVHLDKGHIWERSPNLEGTFDNAIALCLEDSNNWHAEDLYRRMTFGLKCSYARGTKVLRTHLDSFGVQAEISFSIFQTLQKEWRDRLTLQAVSSVSLDYFSQSQGVKLANLVAEIGGILGGIAYMSSDLDRQLDTVFTLAKERQLPLDFHVDENGDPTSISLRKVAEAALRHEFAYPISCSHCCSLSLQTQEDVETTLQLVKEAGISIISLPLCNLYLQDSLPGKTPIWRGVTRVREMEKMGIPVAFASDNTRDPFFGFGNLDMLEVFNQAVRIAHLDRPYGTWIDSVTKTPATLLGLPEWGKISVGSSADLVLFKARYYSELLSRPQCDRVVLRGGYPINTTLPDYAELDDLIQI
ncbi:MAG: cytosine deaminase [Jaaginema sp. PMC 1079.18]|nr:cytosine deaminase [Jaaginema sp. PMC 1080.18]MEC4853936.1 cytosine deaminase [Jaaginema sp. PMC 1079.18]MEC4865962.1 cytosine deaminase [Jaaginema sp. PMC 1078.18]